ncbi:tRNA (N6-isopentenyl adenosine(37)-C2)-methylthiotransferase MiaB [Candidatus Falkowbacteria bacterium RIFOXYD2_FULL_35_9]|uniref:tRNA-2-methylthio-N(6)-dimethylallyladenosine synthase n=1 Tax=Candidatus Falkowbacteria bacterium RIFOXYC2_FULL_36_12 TaxID=1798002 RepID=A0A1F5SYQ3_9BACT|nr:MAG: tRNA (N6-isopentenyl adenosine(37)-C2)-methylthiotransferase MiaB [Candidatus Falkowbacteria bacterium RIFOXYC2_FULL_36_12]OGF34646.1 MAG: tRNA (N6-isopentenyl adenosine(37)-C2)-methylthiotransferase MiaB [Candidatus Falkowbacteria bacterium RIFOXYA2_FULL_35_8]OGF46295.1 MAG: tRNA (N6-isopentenyl adenosine(37)-C2)-methylthiotransferase MiaB [Candidatus Falkowbacteria bacterium RIFOXYD2_FULL_35_9]
MDKTYKLITFGCQMNKSDSERVSAVLHHLGYESVEAVDQASLLIVNACSVRQSAIDRIWGDLKKFRLIREKKKITFILTGCLLAKDKEKFSTRFDFVFDIKNLCELENYLHSRDMVGDNYLDVLPKYSSKFQAYVPIMTGCNNFCSYCAVPYVRGREDSRSVSAVMEEISNLAKNGCKEIILLGQNVNSYDPKDAENFSKNNPFEHNFARLLWQINQLSGLDRISFVSAHPKDMTQEVVQALALPKMLNFIHLALQSGSDTILQKMNRKYTSEDYEKIIAMIRMSRPSIAVGTDIIVGFPGETEDDFQKTYDFYQKINFDICYTAQYSPRLGTKASELVDDVPKATKKHRWQMIQTRMEELTLAINQKYLNQVVEVLVDKYQAGYCEGNSREMKRTRFTSSEDLSGQIIKVNITSPKMWILDGEKL